MPADLGVAILGISPEEFREAVAEVTEELADIRQTVFDLIMDMLGAVGTRLDKDKFLAELTARDFVQIMAKDPAAATDILQDIRGRAT